MITQLQSVTSSIKQTGPPYLSLVIGWCSCRYFLLRVIILLSKVQFAIPCCEASENCPSLMLGIQQATEIYIPIVVKTAQPPQANVSQTPKGTFLSKRKNKNNYFYYFSKSDWTNFPDRNLIITLSKTELRRKISDSLICLNIPASWSWWIVL